jgi:hypothetical protein
MNASMIYIEFTSRRPQPGLREDNTGTLSLEPFESQLLRFHRAMLAGASGWEGSWSEDRLILHAGRTWRLGPEPEYMTVWHSPTAGLARLDEWDRVFRSGEADAVEMPFREVARIDRAGCYEALLDPVRAQGRIGKLGPDPGGLAVWTLPSYSALGEIARELDGVNEPVRLATAGVYNDVGKEIL